MDEILPPISCDGLSIRGLFADSGNEFTLSLPSLDIAFGDKVALVGANGAGKTTFLEALLGLRPRSGRAAFRGTDMKLLLAQAFNRRRLGVQFQTSCFSEELRVHDIVALHTSLYGGRNDVLLETMGLQALLRRRLRALSGGERQRLSVYFALAHEPDLAALDEPMTGLDESTAASVREVIRAMPCLCLLSTHSAGDLAICDVVLWMSHGRLRRVDAPGLLMADLVGAYRGEVTLSPTAATEPLLTAARCVSGVKRLDVREHAVTLFGDERVGNATVELAERFDADSFAVGKTTFGDLLHAVTDGEEG